MNRRTELKFNPHFNALGYEHSSRDCFTTYYFQRPCNRVYSFCPEELTQRHLLSLAPLSFYRTAFPAVSGGVDWLKCVDALIGACEAIGQYEGRAR